MYDTYFQFDKRPFCPAPQVDRYFPGTAIEDARKTLTRCLQRGEGPAMVVGPSGTGKTLLCQVLAEQSKDSLRVALLQSGRLSSRRALCQAILYEFGRPYRGMDEGEVRLALVDYLMTDKDCQQGVVLLVDEAHTLPLRLLEEIRMLTNLSGDGRPLIRVVLAGAAVLEERFTNPKLDSFNQRMAGRCYLESLNRTETQDYILAQVNSVGGQGEQIFPQETCQSVYQATDGVPRLINQVCDHALLLAYVAGQPQVSPSGIEEAWADLQQLPTPWSAQPDKQTAEDNVIEFGGLDDSPDESELPAAGGQADSPVRISPGSDPIGASAGEPEEQLQRIENLLANAEEDFEPAATIGPEVELTFEEAIHPFRDKFDKEEIVADRYTPAAQPAAEESTPVETSRCEEPAADAPAVETVPLRPAEPVETGAWEEPASEAAVGVGAEHSPGEPPCPIATVRRHEYGRLFARLRRG